MLLTDKISKKYIKQELSESPFIIEVKGKVTSTNTIMKKAVRKGAKEFSVLIASEQTAGRGRLGRSFHSPKATGVYMSVLIPVKEGSNPLLITTDAAVCCARVFEKMIDGRVGIKWVNDIYLRGKKVCGILTEGVSEYAILGVGINILPPREGFPEDIKNRAGAVFEHNEPYLREKVIVEFLQELFYVYQKGDRKQIFDEYKERSIILGKEILILRNDGQENATALAINDDYSLFVKKENGETENINCGDVSIKI